MISNFNKNVNFIFLILGTNVVDVIAIVSCVNGKDQPNKLDFERFPINNEKHFKRTNFNCLVGLPYVINLVCISRKLYF